MERTRMERTGVSATLNDVTRAVLGAAIDVHRALGPGLLESAYEACLVYELQARGLRVERQVPQTVRYKAMLIDCGYRIDLLVEDQVVVEFKTVHRILPVHEAQLLSYLKLSGRPVGLLINFRVTLLRDGIRRFVH